VPSDLTIAISPYHLATREVPALCSLLLADQAVTLMPTPASGSSTDDLDAAVKQSPRFLRFMERIRWSVPLWRAGILSGDYSSENIVDGLGAVYSRVMEGEDLGPLRRIFTGIASATEHELLDKISGDLLKGGPDPAVNIPINACVDEFASRHSILVARAAPTSLAQRAESYLYERRFAFAMPVLTQASGRRLLELRDHLRPTLATLRAAILSAVADEAGVAVVTRAESNGRQERTAAAPSVTDAARRLSLDFESARGDLLSGDDDEGTRIMHAYASVTAVRVPSDAVLRSSLLALRSASLAKPIMAGASPKGSEIPDQDPARAERVTVLVMKLMNMRPEN